ncbi:asparagine synthetase B family protein [Erythrobacter sp. F6033]|uniref:asparagine synthase-related protein n=1 Tax=Erythrobacter sp. F6033 TaxID=2926401 RepID=UPI001FF16F1C|nr:asparagine synthetase B family protein [Erythrobacter sp. F6033]MCK0127768.1 asparagine synthase-related protein [Erythrobacter sp. F6033]
MASFAVILRKSNRPLTGDLTERMRSVLGVFGPDKDGVVSRGPIQMIWTQDVGFTPQDRWEEQPVVSHDRWHLLFVGFLMHREELADKVGLERAELTNIPDSKLVMMAWEKWGETCHDHLYGAYSFVVCDIANHTIIAKRGSEVSASIYYHEDDDRLILTTSTKAIFCDETVERKVDESRIADALVLNFENRTQSYFAGISILPSGHSMRANPHGLRVERTSYLDRTPDVRFANDDDYVEAAGELLSRAVSSSMRSLKPPALMLSSGLDSASVAAVMIEHMAGSNATSDERLKAFTHVPAGYWDGSVRNGWAGDESGPVKAMAALYPQLDVEFVGSELLPFDHGLDLVQSYADMPLRGLANLYWGREIDHKCLQSGRNVMLTGSSGNATLSFAMKSMIFGKLFRKGQWLRLLKEHHLSYHGNVPGPFSYLKRLTRQAILPNAPDSLFGLYARHRAPDKGKGFHAFSAINPDYAEEMGVRERMAEFGWDDGYRLPKDRKEMMRIMAERGGREEASALVEPYKAAAGTVTRDPLGDRKIVEFCYAIPDDQFCKDGTDRRLIKRMMADKLPSEVLNAPRGEQSADWHGRMGLDIERIDSELDRLSDDPMMAKRLDLKRLRKLTKNWPEKTPVSQSEFSEHLIARYAIGRAISVARFINQVEGKN